LLTSGKSENEIKKIEETNKKIESENKNKANLLQHLKDVARIIQQRVTTFNSSKIIN
jgi:hypothetical protein